MSKLYIRASARAFEVTVNSGGFFQVEVDGADLHAPSFKELEAKVTKHLKLKLSIRFCRLDGDRWDSDDKEKKLRRGVITGIHSGNDNLLIKWDDEKKIDQSYTHSEYLRLTEKEEQAYLALHRAYVKACADLERFREEHAIDVREEIKRLETQS